jgi:hypothetical protein
MFSVIEDFSPSRLCREHESGLLLSWGGWCRSLAQTSLADELARACANREHDVRPPHGPAGFPRDRGSEEHAA